MQPWSLSPLDRIAHYRLHFGPAFLTYEAGWLCGHWEIGNSYRKKTRYYGAYQGNYLKRIAALFPDRGRVLHLFAGMVDTDTLPGDTLDIRPGLNPTYCVNAETCEGVPLHLYDFVLADPPYSKDHAKNYGTSLPSARKVMTALAAGMRPGSRVAWLDQRKPMYRKAEWKYDTVISITGSTNHCVRGLFVFTRR